MLSDFHEITLRVILLIRIRLPGECEDYTESVILLIHTSWHVMKSDFAGPC